MYNHLRGDGADGQSNKLVTIEFICRKSAMQDQSRILVMTILLLLDYAQGKVGKEVFISDGATAGGGAGLWWQAGAGEAG